MREFEKVKFMSEYGTLDYNCGGYALGAFNWVNIDSLLFFYSTKEELIAKATKEAVKELLQRFDYIRVVDKKAEITKEEFLIYFRISHDGDFHFLKEKHNGKIYHKMGSLPVCKFHGNPYEKRWSNVNNYCGPIVLFAVSNSHYERKRGE